MKFNKLAGGLLVLLITASCSKENHLEDSQKEMGELNGIENPFQIEEGKLKFESKEGLSGFINDNSEENFEKTVRKIQGKSFKPLVPIFTEEEGNLKEKFLQKKRVRLKNKSSLYTSKNMEDSEIDIDDELIFDDRFAALLNEDREIIVGNNLYIYTKKGLYFANLKHESKLRDYLQSLELKAGQNKYIEPCLSEDDGYSQPTQEITRYVECGGGGGGGYTPPPSPPSYDAGAPSKQYPDFPLDIKRSLGTCVVDDTSLWQEVFGAAETCHDYFADDRRAKTKFWNQNYVVFSSIGMSVKHQKRNFWIWDSSSATDYIELGMTNVSFKYNFNTAVYDQIFQNIQSDVIFQHKGKTYTADGTVITGYPVQSSPLPLDASDNQALTVYLFNRNNDIINEQEANDIIRDAVRDFISTEGSALETPVSNTSDDYGVNGVVIDPLDNSVTYTIMGRNIRRNGGSSITKILDFNFLIGWELEITGGGNYSVGKDGPSYNTSTSVDAFGATTYTDVTLDFYGVVKRNGKYRGNRVVSENL